MNAIREIEEADCQVVSSTFDSNAINFRMVSSIPNLDQAKSYLSRMNDHPIFWLNDSVHVSLNVSGTISYLHRNFIRWVVMS